MNFPYPTASIDKMPAVMRKDNRIALRGALTISLMESEDFRMQSVAPAGAPIIKTLISALYLPNGHPFTESTPSFTLSRSSLNYPNLFTVSSPLNRGSPKNSSLATEAAAYLTKQINEKVPAENPLFLLVRDRSRIESAAILGGFVALGAELAPYVLLNGNRYVPPERVTYPDIPFSQLGA